MLTLNDFSYGEHETQYYYEFKNEVLDEIVCVMRNKTQDYWMAFLLTKNSPRTIPIEFSTNVMTFISDVCDWYNNGKEFSSRPEQPEIIVTKHTDLLLNLKDGFGLYNRESALRIQSYLKEPSVERWDDIHGILISPRYTVWQAILLIDSTFPKSGRSYNIKDEIVKDWTRIPDPLLLLRAIKNVFDII